MSAKKIKTHDATPIFKDSISAADERFYSLYNTLRDRICLLDYSPGQQLSEVKLAEEFNISRTPVRRVLNRLEFDGLVSTSHGAGNFVTEIKLDYLCEVYRLRMELAPLIGRMSPRQPSAQLIQRMQELQYQCADVIHSENPKRIFATLNMHFFEALMELVGNRPLKQQSQYLFYQAARMWPYLMDESIVKRESKTFAKEIREVIRVLQSGVVSAVGDLRRVHIEVALYRLVEMSPEQCISN
jgi:DNA-binding GntR family transcriptional regulator